MTEAAAKVANNSPQSVRDLVRGSAFSAGGMTLGGGLTVLAGIVFTRWLGPEGFGAYSLALVVISFAAGLGTFGMDNTVPRFSAVYLGSGQTAQIRPMIRFGVRYSVIGSILLAVAVWVLLRWGMGGLERLQGIRGVSGWIVLGVPLIAVQLVALQTILGLQLVRSRVVLEKTVQPLLRLLLPFALVLWAADRLHAAIGGVVISAAIVTLCTAVLIKFRVRQMPRGVAPQPKLRREWLSYSVPFVLYSLQNFVSAGMGIDVLLVALLVSVSDSGIYAAAFRFTPILVLARGAIDCAFGPKVGLLYGQAESEDPLPCSTRVRRRSRWPGPCPSLSCWPSSAVG